MDNKGIAGIRCRRVDNREGDRIGGNGGTAVGGQIAVNKKAPIHYTISINDMVYRPL